MSRLKYPLFINIQKKFREKHAQRIKKKTTQRAVSFQIKMFRFYWNAEASAGFSRTRFTFSVSVASWRCVTEPTA